VVIKVTIESKGTVLSESLGGDAGDFDVAELIDKLVRALDLIHPKSTYSIREDLIEKLQKDKLERGHA
jgi:hypothetical protein